jgi:hypothetical protein
MEFTDESENRHPESRAELDPNPEPVAVVKPKQRKPRQAQRDHPVPVPSTNGNGQLTTGINLFDPDRIRIGTNYGDLVGVRSADLTFPVWSRPPKVPWFRAHPTNEVDILMLDLTVEDSEGLYYLDKVLWPKLVHEPTVGLRLLVQCQTQQGTNFLWAIKLKSPFDKRENAWTASALKERDLARSRWIRHRSNRELGAYDPAISDAIETEPIWPDMPFAKILEIALKDRYIDSLDHEVLVGLLRGK